MASKNPVPEVMDRLQTKVSALVEHLGSVLEDRDRLSKELEDLRGQIEQNRELPEEVSLLKSERQELIDRIENLIQMIEQSGRLEP